MICKWKGGYLWEEGHHQEEWRQGRVIRTEYNDMTL